MNNTDRFRKYGFICQSRWMILLFALLVAATIETRPASGQLRDTLPELKDGLAPKNLDEMWDGFDPRAEPIETETIKQWEEDDVVLRIVRFRIGVFKGQKATLAAVYGFPKSAKTTKVPGLVQIHGGGQYAHYRSCLLNAKRGYATISIAWAGRIDAPDYLVSPDIVKLFWADAKDDPRYKLTTDWGAVDGYHAPGRNPKNSFPSDKAAEWTLDSVPSPRNSGWFLCALAARRSLTFLERQPEVDANKLGVYGHSMGGKLTVMTSVDPRVKAAAPSCGGISDRDNKSELFRNTIGDDVSLIRIACPIFFLSPANDFHGRIGDLPASIAEISSKQWRVTCSPHHNHQDTDSYEVATLLWFDQHLKQSFVVPNTPQTKLTLITPDGVPVLTVQPDRSKPIVSVDVFYTQHGKANETPADHEDTKTRFWHHAKAVPQGENWISRLPLHGPDRPLWVYANVRYKLDRPVVGAGYYYRQYNATEFNLSSLLKQVSPAELGSAGVKSALMPTNVIESFQPGWQHEWFTYKPNEWARTTNKLRDKTYHPRGKVNLVLDVRTRDTNKLVMMVDSHAAEVTLLGSDEWQTVTLKPEDFKNYDGEGLADFVDARQLKLSPAERLRPKRGSKGKDRIVGKKWRGADPMFRNLRWQSAD